jgi:hypothetical protein
LFGLAGALAGTAPHAKSGPVHDAHRERVCHYSAADRTLRPLRDTVVRIERRGGERVFTAVPINRTKGLPLTVGVAY